MSRINKVLEEAFSSPLLGNVTDKMTPDEIVRLIKLKGGKVGTDPLVSTDRYVIEFGLGPVRYKVIKILQGPGVEKGWQVQRT